MPTDSVTWRGIRQDLESLPGADWSLIWTSRPPMAFFLPIQLHSQWTWLHPTDASLRARASAIFVKASTARGYDSEDRWLEELRYADFVGFQISGDAREKLPNGTLQERESGVLTEAVKHSITLCHQLEAGDVPKPIALRLSSEAIARIDAAKEDFLRVFVTRLKREVPKPEHKPDRQQQVRKAKLVRGLVIHHFETAAREYMAVYDSTSEFEAELRAGIARFVHFSVSQYRWLGEAMRNELQAGFIFFLMQADPWAGVAAAEKDDRWHKGAITGEALEDTALKLAVEAKARGVKDGFYKKDLGEGPESSSDQVSHTPRKRGPKPDLDSAVRVAQIVAKIATDGDWRTKLDDLRKAFMDADIPSPRRWRSTSWSDQEDALVIKVIKRRLDRASKPGKKTPA
jgi:hypothetical protein